MIDRLWLASRRALSRARTSRPRIADRSGVAEIRWAEAVALNAGRCSIVGDALAVVTDPASGGYSALIPVVPRDGGDGPAVLGCEVDLHEGLIGICAVMADYAIIAERLANRHGRQRLEVHVPNLRDVAGILIRNAAFSGIRSRANVGSFAAETTPARPIFLIPSGLPSSMLRLKLRAFQYDGEVWSLGQSRFSDATIETGKLAAIIVDAWDQDASGEPRDERADRNIADAIAPTLKTLRSIGLSIVHAPHDRPIHPSVQPTRGETVLPGELNAEHVANVLRDAGITHLLYMGHYSNMCLVSRTIGQMEMMRRGFHTILVRDLSVAKETEESVSGEWFHKAMIHFVEINGGSTISAAELRSAIEEMKNERNGA